MYTSLVEEILKVVKIIAVVGCSTNPQKAAYQVPKYLQDNGYKIIPINPNAKEILGEKAFTSLNDLNGKVDLVLVFRPSEETPIVTKQAVGQTKYIWFQLGIENESAEEIAKAAGIPIIMNKCIMVEHKALF